jgi:ATP-dependent helicase/nuclease subunit A
VIRYHSGAVSEEIVRRETVRQEEEEAVDLEDLLADLTWQYPHDLSTATPAKVTATQVVGEEDTPGAFLLDQGVPQEPKAFYRPQFAQEELGLTAAQKGTALHTAMQCIRLDRTGDLEEIKQELARMVSQEYLTEQQAKAVDVHAMARFFGSDLGRELRESADLHREYPFSILAPAHKFYPDVPEGEEVLLQGVIDCWFSRLDGITIVDFKTDRVSAAEAPERAENYRGQLAAYAYALEELTGRKVTRRILWFLRPNVGVALPD